MYVFGVDIPMMEILFVMIILFLVALIMIFLELRRMRILLFEEEGNISRFEQGINRMEKKKS